MELLSENELIWSPIVANNRMNRKRSSSGINSYEKELKFKPEAYLNTLLEQKSHVTWLDLCCGEGNALLQYARALSEKDYQDRVTLLGIDLVDQFQPIPQLFIACDLKLLPWSVGQMTVHMTSSPAFTDFTISGISLRYCRRR